MSADKRTESDGLRESLDVLTERVDTLAAMVREATGGIAANRGQVSALDRRLQELTGQACDQTSADLAALRGEIDALRGFLADQPNRSDSIAAAASDPLRETITELAGRIDTLGEVVRSTSGRMVGEQNRTSELADALAEQDSRAEARFAEIQRRLETVSQQAEQALKAPPAQPPDAALEARVANKVGVLVDRVDFLAETATATAGRLAATDGELSTFQQRSSEALSKLERRSEEALARTEGALQAMRGDLETVKSKHDVDPMLSDRMSSLLNSVEALGSRVGTLSGIVSETAGRVAGREREIAGLDSRIDEVSLRIESVATQLRSEIDAIAAAPAGATSTGAETDARTEALGSHLALLESALAETAGATEQLGLDLRNEVTSLAAAVAQEHHEVVEATRALEARGVALEARMDSLSAFASSSAARGSEEVEALAAAVVRRHAEVLEVTAEWEARRADLERRMDDLTTFAASTAERGADEMSRALTTLAVRLERLEHDRQAVATDATYVESSWAEERAALEIRLDEIAASITAEVSPTADVGRLVDELADRLARMEDERGAVADLAALAETWTSELASLEARVDQGLATLGDQDLPALGDEAETKVAVELVENVDDLAHRIEQIETDRDVVRAELAKTATSWATERAALQERVSELAALIVTGPMHASAPGAPDAETEHTPVELDRLRIGVEGLRMRLAYHEKTVSDLAGSKGVMQRLDELGTRLDQLSAIVMAQQTGHLPVPGPAQTLPAAPVVETSGILTRLDKADQLRAQSREKMLEQMEKIATRLDWRLQRLEAAGVPVAAGVDEN
ncbi:hypothetical protein [Gaiella sp.]|uniref:hypothetical protein n=1 Tax=Gaiella sp. TaxID=2663207 RepID=UPI0032634370